MSELRDAVEQMGALVRGKDGTPLHLFFANETVVVTRHQWQAILDLVEAADRQAKNPCGKYLYEYGEAERVVMDLAGRE